MSNSRSALITGVTGQDGSYLAEFLHDKGYRVIGVTRDAAAPAPSGTELIVGDVVDPTFIERLIENHRPDEVYNLASVATVASPWDDPLIVGAIAGMTPVAFLDTISHHSPATRFFQASSAEMYGNPTESPQSERTPFAPTNPYGAAKLFAHRMTELYRQRGLFAVSGILFNHESPRRSERFVTQKIVRTLETIARGDDAVLTLGNLDAQRDWSFAGDIVEGMWRALQHETSGTYVFASGETHTVREFVEEAARLFHLSLHWEGNGPAERGVDAHGRVVVEISPDFYRPRESHPRCGDISYTKQTLGWTPATTFSQLVEMMCAAARERI